MEKVTWDDAQVFLTRLNEQQAGNLPAAGVMFYPPNRNGNMPELSCWNDHGLFMGTITSLHARMRISNGNFPFGQMSAMLVDLRPIRGADMHGNVWEWTADNFQWLTPPA